MNAFENISFKGEFRDYQQRVLDNFGQHIADGKIHIVAAPGSGKTVLGLELIRRVGKPALILSPTITIREQWKERFEALFCDENTKIDDVFSCDIRNPKLITSITYQALYAAMNRKKYLAKIEDEDSEEIAETADYSDFDFVEKLHEYGIQTICLDEAHHLRAEWQKSLETFVSSSKNEMTVISLTATPPYGSSPSEWNKYEALCGEIDDEIFVPQLVAQKSLCPHQDYILFNYPTKKESDILLDYQHKSFKVALEIIRSKEFADIINLPFFVDFQQHEEFLLDHVKPCIALLCCLRKAEIQIDEKLLEVFHPSKRLPPFKIEHAETAFQFILDNEDIFSQETYGFVRAGLISQDLVYRKNVCIKINEKLKRMLASSYGKLDSIVTIVSEEYTQQHDDLRMLILTDFIKSDFKRIIGTDEEIGLLGTVTIFETLRRKDIPDLKLAVLSGGLVIVPDSIVFILEEKAHKGDIVFLQRHIQGTRYSELHFSSSNKLKVALLTEAFQEGLIHVMIGTKSLLGEGWDAPCINALILASNVGSFMLSNQMRGRAIRIDVSNPQKTANIWHLVTIDPYEKQKDGLAEFADDESTIFSSDYATCARKFNYFLGPSYHEDIIESGIARCNIIKPPFNKAGFQQINCEMIALSRDREAMRKTWDRVFENISHPEVLEVSELPVEPVNTGFVYRNVFWLLFLTSLLGGTGAIIGNLLGQIPFSPLILLLLLTVSGFISIGYWDIINTLISALSPKKKMRKMLDSLLDTLCHTDDIKSRHAKVVMLSTKDNFSICCGLEDATQHEKTLFSKAVQELFSAIDNPRYVIIGQKKMLSKRLLNYFDSFACPSIIGKNKSDVDYFLSALNNKGLKFTAVFTRNAKGREILLKCRKNSIRNRNQVDINGNKIVKSKWE